MIPVDFYRTLNEHSTLSVDVNSVGEVTTKTLIYKLVFLF